MFKAEDFISYFSEIEMLERNMRDIYREAANQISDAKTRKIFEGLSKAEERHQVLAEELRRIAIKNSLKEQK